MISTALPRRPVPAPTAPPWRTARIVTWAIVATAFALTGWRIVAGDQIGPVARVDSVTVVVLGLVGLIGWVVVRFASRYLAGDPSERRAARCFAATLASVAAVILANDLMLVGIAWTATSLSMHGLLTHDRERPVAVAVAHKKFVLARAADLCMVGSIVAFAATYGTTRLDSLTAAAAAEGLPLGAHLAVLLVALAAVLKCAQLPFHGWLIQVMEAPTPVSALLHAGVVNLGGLVLLRLAPVVDRAPVVQLVLVAAGGFTAVVAALVMTTRVSAKVALAWSTCAQMGIMLVQCGLGLWELALLHLVAHSLYKAHAFLRAGSTVSATLRHRLVAEPTTPTSRELVAGLLVSVIVTVGLASAWSTLPWATPLGAAAWVFVGALAFAGSNLTVAAIQRRQIGLAPRMIGLLLAAYALHDVAGRLVAHGPTPPLATLVLAGAYVTLLFIAQVVTALAPTAPIVRQARAWLFRGLFLDETFTRLVFSVWPPPPPAPRAAPLPSPAAALAVEAPLAVTVS